MCFRLVPKSVTLNDLERRNGPYFALFLQNLVISAAYCVKVVVTAITMYMYVCMYIYIRAFITRRSYSLSSHDCASVGQTEKTCL